MTAALVRFELRRPHSAGAPNQHAPLRASDNVNLRGFRQEIMSCGVSLSGAKALHFELAMRRERK